MADARNSPWILGFWNLLSASSHHFFPELALAGAADEHALFGSTTTFAIRAKTLARLNHMLADAGEIALRMIGPERSGPYLGRVRAVQHDPVMIAAAQSEFDH